MAEAEGSAASRYRSQAYVGFGSNCPESRYIVQPLVTKAPSAVEMDDGRDGRRNHWPRSVKTTSVQEDQDWGCRQSLETARTVGAVTPICQIR